MFLAIIGYNMVWGLGGYFDFCEKLVRFRLRLSEFVFLFGVTVGDFIYCSFFVGWLMRVRGG